VSTLDLEAFLPPAPQPSQRFAVPSSQPEDIPPAPQPELLVWKSTKSDAPLDHGRPMTAETALAYAESGAANAHDFRQLTPTHITWISGFGARCTYEGTLPIPVDPHAVVQDLHTALLDLPLTIRQGDLLIKALDAAADSPCPDCPVCAPLLQMLATSAVRP
jgi:hypothetical protein